MANTDLASIIAIIELCKYSSVIYDLKSECNIPIGRIGGGTGAFELAKLTRKLEECN